MEFSVNYVAVLVATVAAAIASAAWYSFLFAAQVNTMRAADLQIAGRAAGPPLIALSVVANLIAAFVLAVLIESIFGPEADVVDGLITAALCWLGFAMTALTVIHTFGYRHRAFVVVDGGYWLVVLLLMGVVIGAFGS
jgi:hypothetical protein